MSRQDQAVVWARDALSRLRPQAEVAGLLAYCGEPFYVPYLEWPVDLLPVEGSVLEVNNQWILTCSGRGRYFVCACEVAENVPLVGSEVRITPYARRNFEGRRLDGFNESAHPMESSPNLTPGRWRARVPIGGTVVQSSKLLALLDYIEVLRAPDRMRRLSHVLVDAGANLEALSIIDFSGRSDRPRPSITFRVRTQKTDGWLRIECSSVSSDELRLYLLSPDGELLRTGGLINADILAALIVDWVDDGLWRVARVETLFAKSK